VNHHLNNNNRYKSNNRKKIKLINDSHPLISDRSATHFDAKEKRAELRDYGDAITRVENSFVIVTQLEMVRNSPEPFTSEFVEAFARL